MIATGTAAIWTGAATTVWARIAAVDQDTAAERTRTRVARSVRWR